MVLKCAVKYCKPGQLCGVCEAAERRKCCPDCGHSMSEGCGCPPWVRDVREKYKVQTNFPELYPKNLETLKHVMARLDLMGRIDGVFDVEVYIRLEDIAVWAVVGYGESGNPCILRFEEKN